MVQWSRHYVCRYVFPILSSSSTNHSILQYLKLRELRFARQTKPATTWRLAARPLPALLARLLLQQLPAASKHLKVAQMRTQGDCKCVKKGPPWNQVQSPQFKLPTAGHQIISDFFGHWPASLSSCSNMTWHCSLRPLTAPSEYNMLTALQGLNPNFSTHLMKHQSSRLCTCSYVYNIHISKTKPITSLD